MASYWIIIDNEKIGPISLDQVRSMALTGETLVWRDGMQTWRQARFVPELADVVGRPCCTSPYDRAPHTGYVAERTPALEEQMAASHQKPTTYLAWSIVAICLCCTIPAIVALFYAARVSSLYDADDYDGANRASDRAELWLIISITLGVIAVPFEMALML